MNCDPEIICDKCDKQTVYNRRVTKQDGHTWYLIYKCPECGKEFKY